MTSVRTHTRRTRGGTTTVHRHDRSGRSWHQMQKRRRPRRKGLSPRRGLANLGRAFGYGRRRKRVAALSLGVLGTFELGAWTVSRGALVIGVAAFALCVVFVGPLVWSIRKDLKAGQETSS